MFGILLESAPRTARRPRAALASLVAHVVIIVSVVGASAARHDPPAPPERLSPPIFIPAAPTPTPQPPRPTRPATPSAPRVPEVALPMIPVPTEIPNRLPTIPLPGARPDSPVWRVPGPSHVGIDPARDPAAGPGDGDPGIAWSDQVDRAARQLGRVRVPNYPDLLRRDRTEGAVLATWVVDTLGRVEPGSFRAVSATHPLFEQAVRGVVLEMRFRPAEARGRRVRQLVEQHFIFSLTR